MQTWIDGLWLLWSRDAPHALSDKLEMIRRTDKGRPGRPVGLDPGS
jgi:hypothetical protein